jgi:hypothetical protein
MVLRNGSLLFDGHPEDCGFHAGSGSSAAALDVAYLTLIGR